MARPIIQTTQQLNCSNEAPSSQDKDFKLPYRMTAEYGNARFGELYEKAMMRKRLFKEYMLRNQVLERLNQSIEALYDCEVLPENPLDFIAAHIKSPTAQPTAPSTVAANTPTVRPAPAFIITGPGSMASQQQQHQQQGFGSTQRNGRW